MNARELIMQMREHDSERAFNALFEMEYERMFRVAFYYVQNDDWAKEVALDVLASLWETRKTMVVPVDFRSFSFAMVKNRALNMLKKEARKPLAVAAEGESEASSPEELMEQDEVFETYNNLVSSLPHRCREVFCRVKEDGMSYAEVAAEMQISVKTVDAQLQKALRVLREGLNKYVKKDSAKRIMMIFL